MIPKNRMNEKHEADFNKIMLDARSGLEMALDLIIIHNEKSVHGPQPRTSLNPLTLMLSVAAWERFISDTASLANNEFIEVGASRSKAGYMTSSQNGEGVASMVLEIITEGKLPGNFYTRNLTGWTGKTPHGTEEIYKEEIADTINDAIRTRNGIAHRALSQTRENAKYLSDAASHTLQSGQVRGVTGLFLQLIDQAGHHISEASGFSSEYRLPSTWFESNPPRLRGVSTPGPLWGEADLWRP